MNCDKEITAKKITSEEETTEQTLFINTTWRGGGAVEERGSGAVTPRQTRVEPSTEQIPVFVSRHISPRNELDQMVGVSEAPTRGQRSERLWTEASRLVTEVIAVAFMILL